MLLPRTYAKPRLAGVAPMEVVAVMGAGEITSVTAMVCGLLETPEDVTVTVAPYVPGAKLAGFAETVTTAGVLDGDTDAESHAPPATLTATGLEGLLLTVTVWLGGAAAPAVAVKFSVEALRLMLDWLETTKVTLTVCELEPADMVTVPV